jgi:hypothetical protein
MERSAVDGSINLKSFAFGPFVLDVILGQKQLLEGIGI